MNQHTLKIVANNQASVLERLLQVTRYRGFDVTSFTMFPRPEHALFDIELSVRSEQCIERLTLQLQKLIDIKTIEVNHSQTQQVSA
jgi:acetolactate synthase II small subunit